MRQQMRSQAFLMTEVSAEANRFFITEDPRGITISESKWDVCVMNSAIKQNETSYNKETGIAVNIGGIIWWQWSVKETLMGRSKGF